MDENNLGRFPILPMRSVSSYGQTIIIDDIHSETLMRVLGVPKVKAILIMSLCSALARQTFYRYSELVDTCIDKLKSGETPSEVYNWIQDQVSNPESRPRIIETAEPPSLLY